ncbi:MAG: PEP-CTERM sorting domain-containing protein [Candidatus Omnitrophota bacterium]|nr:PEP-CTERM sorting domain-containing protein [Candidatus Omnitrophota bacterium]
MKKQVWGLALASVLAAVIGARSAEAVLIFGSTPFAGAGGFSATVAWEVFAPGDGGSYLPNADATFDYFYIVTNTSTTASLGNAITTFNVGNPNGSVISTVGSLPLGGATPTLSLVLAGGTSYLFFTPSICPPGLPAPCGGLTSSDRLFLTSPDGPTNVLGGLIASGGATDSQLVPGPQPPQPFIPEPASMGLFGLGLGALGFARRRRKSA